MIYYVDTDTAGLERISGRRSLRKRRAARRRRRRIFIGMFLILAAGVFFYGKAVVSALFQTGESMQVRESLSSMRQESYQKENYGLESYSQGSAPEEKYPEELQEMLEKNEEAYDFVTNYPNREQYMGQDIDISDECSDGEVPLLMQWDRRWGYDDYGDSMIGVAGCGPTCMAMAYLYQTGDTQMNPRAMAEYASENGYCTESGTSWDFFTRGAEGLGLSGRELPLDEVIMKRSLDQGCVIICSMRPGDFTTTGHFILLRGYDDAGFYVNDPNRKTNSEKQWDFETLKGQIKCLWEIGM